MPIRAFFAGRPGTDHDPAWWAAVHALYDEAFPGLPRGIAAARAAGVDWRTVTTPFALFENGRCVAHVGLIWHPMLLDGHRLRVAGVHAVCTAQSHRRQGLCRELLEAALAHAGPALAKLHTDDPPVYTGRGFRVVPTWRFAAATAPRMVHWRPLHPIENDLDNRILRDLLKDRSPVSHRCSSADEGWMVLIDAALSGRLAGDFRLLPDHEAVVCGERMADGRVLVTACIARELPPAEVVLGALADLGEHFVWSFSPDRLDPAAVPEPAPARIGHFMVRGGWPVAEPFGISPLWEH
jgi:GNAT superfamily N-acetyltransferase